MRSGPGDEREDGDAVEVLHLARGKGVVEHVHRDADDLALLLADPRDRVHQVPLAEREADRHLVHDALVEDRREVLQAAQERGTGREVEGGVVVDVAQHVQAELPVLGQPAGKRLAAGAGADDHHEPSVVAALAQPAEAETESGTRAQGQHELGGEEDEQEEAADVRDLEEEEHGE